MKTANENINKIFEKPTIKITIRTMKKNRCIVMKLVVDESCWIFELTFAPGDP